MKNKTLWITQTAILTALLIVLQYVTASLGQLVTGSCVNAVLAFSALSVGITNGAAIAILSPFFAFLLGIGPKFLPLIPCIAAGNLIYVVIIAVIAGKGLSDTKNAVSVGAGAVGKFLTLQFLVVKWVCETFPLKAKQITMFTKMFSWPQLITAFIGGVIAMLLARALRKVINKEKNRLYRKENKNKEKADEAKQVNAEVVNTGKAGDETTISETDKAGAIDAEIVSSEEK